MKALAARRHHRLAPIVLLVLALLVTGGLYAVLAPSPATASATNEDDIEQGRLLFLTNCATCHGPNAEGSNMAPSLIGVGAASVDFQVSTGRMPMQMHGPQAPVKPPQFDAQQVRQLAAYVASLGPGPAIPSADQVDPELGDAANGMALFRTNCAMCHGSVGSGGALTQGKDAPGIGNSTPTQIYEAMATGPQSMPVFNDANLTPDEKRDVIAFLMKQRDGAPGGISLNSLGPVAEGLWAWVIGIGLLIGSAVWLGAKSS